MPYSGDGQAAHGARGEENAIRARVPAALIGDEACATNSISCAERADPGRRDRHPERRGRALMHVMPVIFLVISDTLDGLSRL